ncbi:unnamed protein product [Acanthoscelides obtectus]|uniref:Uncharacterized protein n=1 Tax=Acanthoscelides obtectus TaxID=200917 RepID=A0A9P0KZ25_ACAOB|nr:unnamed protein product [Acanthoscelides obtectus]CAK1660459.1 hypothetical protein AOBTE_LOCUS22081 [Acanthoscelides obtectus]
MFDDQEDTLDDTVVLRTKKNAPVSLYVLMLLLFQ